MPRDLDGKVAIVTGGAGGFGEGIVRLFVAEGARVLIADIEHAKAQKLAGDLGYLASDAARFITGIELPVDGGRTI